MCMVDKENRVNMVSDEDTVEVKALVPRILRKKLKNVSNEFGSYKKLFEKIVEMYETSPELFRRKYSILRG